MPVTRREFIAGIGVSGLVYVLGTGCTKEVVVEAEKKLRAVPKPNYPNTDFREWLLIGDDGTVSVFTSRNELGQGITTVFNDLICQGLELPRERVRIVLGDTDLCPNDGPTTGSAATRHVAWRFWEACAEIREDLVHLAAERLNRPPEELIYRSGEIVPADGAGPGIGIGELAEEGGVQRLRADSANGDRTAAATPMKYVDRGNLNVNGEAIVTGTLRYAGDLYPDGCLYGGLLVPEYHRRKTRPLEVDATAALQVPGIKLVGQDFKTVVAVGDTFTSVQKALNTAKVRWQVPDRPRQLANEEEIRAGARLVKVVEERGNVDAGLRDSETKLVETYITQYGSTVPIETKTSVAEFAADQTTIRIGTQSPYQVRLGTAERLGVAEDRVHVKSVPAGGAFGSRTRHNSGMRAAVLSKMAGAPVKFVHTRRQEFQMGARYKESVVIDIESGVTKDGRILTRKIDIHQDEGHGTDDVYDIPNVETRLFHSKMPTRHATMRGTSYTQSVFAMESHTDMLARSIGMDALELRRRNVAHEAFLPLIDACAEMIGYGRDPLPDRGIGVAICHHGDRQLGVVGAEVSVNRETGKVTVEKLCGAFDIGIIVNRHTTQMGVKGAMIWGLGFALSEEARFDGHRSFVASFSNYRIPRFSDIPEIDVRFFNNFDPREPRGCGELPLVPTVPAICNAVYNATGVRFHTLPLTPDRVLEALRGQVG